MNFKIQPRLVIYYIVLFCINTTYCQINDLLIERDPFGEKYYYSNRIKVEIITEVRGESLRKTPMYSHLSDTSELRVKTFDENGRLLLNVEHMNHDTITYTYQASRLVREEYRFYNNHYRDHSYNYEYVPFADITKLNTGNISNETYTVFCDSSSSLPKYVLSNKEGTRTSVHYYYFNSQNNLIKHICIINDDTLFIQNYTFYSNMKVQNMQQYKDGSLQTERIVFKESKDTPNLIIDKSYQNGKVVDEWIFYYFNENGIVSRKVSIHNKAIVNECFYSYEFY